MNLLITAAEVVTHAFPDKNFLTAKILDANIWVAQEALLRPALGTALYEYLTAATPTGDYATLVNSYLKPALAMYVRYTILPDIMVHASNTGLQMVQPIGTLSASDKQSGLLRDQAKANAEILLGVALRYIRENPTLFPEYEYHETVRSRTRIIGGVIFGKRHHRRESDRSSGVTPILATGIVRTVVDVRRVTAHATGDMVICAENNYLYEYDSTSTATDNGGTVVKPNDTTTGRWIMSKELQMVNL